MMHLTRLELSGFKSFAKKTAFDFSAPTVAIVGPNGSGKSNVAEAIRFVLGEQSMKSMRGKRGEDLIWNGSPTVPRMSRAGVALTFDNSSRFLGVDFDEVVLERIVHRDGVNEYKLNGSTVRLKDILELLAGANIGESGHHIISQGEADKILSASARERREMLEDALGLKVYQYKKDEALRKLGKTEENMRQVEALRREVQPHLRFLKRQVEKIEKAESLRSEAAGRFRNYFAVEGAYVQRERLLLKEEEVSLAEALRVTAEKIQQARRAVSEAGSSKESVRLLELSEKIESARSRRRSALQESARLSGKLEALKTLGGESSIQHADLAPLVAEYDKRFAASSGDLAGLVEAAQNLIASLRALLSGPSALASAEPLQEEKRNADEKERVAVEEERVLSAELDALRISLEAAASAEREQERALFALSTEERELLHKKESLEGRLARFTLEEEEYKRETAEALVLVGREAVAPLSGVAERSREEQAAEKRELQRIKVRLEEMGAGGGDEVLKEFQEASEREAFLEKELADLSASKESLKTLIGDLDAELSVRFKGGMDAINAEFSHFFSLMFDGGSASLAFVKEPVRRVSSLADDDDDGVPDEMEKTIEGIEISLNIPRKRVKSLTMLSGGERALTSIALIFAMSSVNPPPFLVLDETDAALDEANSRRYGDMISALSKKSQLVLITHNRETMSRASILYGVTMAGDGVSKVLSVKLEEAVRVAK